MKYFWDHWPSISKWMHLGKRVMLFLDYDGTLSTIVHNPKEACMKPGITQALRKLSQSPHYKLVIISGRSLKDLRQRVNFKNVLYAGNHGLELFGGKLSTPKEVKNCDEKVLMEKLVRKLRATFRLWPEIIIENKGLTVSLHYRKLPKDCMPNFLELIRFVKGCFYPERLIWRQGKKVWEARPQSLLWNKGHATHYIRNKYPDSLVMAIGDDVTDEDMFKEIGSEGIAVRVGRSKRSLAGFYFKSIGEVETFLRKLCD